MKYIFITGGVSSSIGKGIIAASCGYLLHSQKYKIRIKKIEPYFNIDAGMLNPYEHGEVFITEDGAETDLDLGTYERFTNIDARKTDIITSGQVFQDIFKKERNGEMLGQTIQIVPHVTESIIRSLQQNYDEDYIIYEVGGTIGDLESTHFLKAISDLQYRIQCVFIHVGWVPYLSGSKENKTKPMQQSINTLRQFGINPNIVICRSENEIQKSDMSKISRITNIKPVFNIKNEKNIYDIPARCKNVIYAVHDHFKTQKSIVEDYNYDLDINIWNIIAKRQNDLSDEEVTVGIVGKYFDNADAYKSLEAAISHASLSIGKKIKIQHIYGERRFDVFDLHGIIIPGGFGYRETENMIYYISEARRLGIPFFGICFGMHLSIIEFSRSVLNIPNASSEEFNLEETYNVIVKNTSPHNTLGGTMRLGSKQCRLNPKSRIYAFYQSDIISERHRHRYTVLQDIIPQLESNGMKITGTSINGIVESIELPNHPWFVAVQFHPEMKSRPLEPHPLFISFAKAMFHKKNNLFESEESFNLQQK